MDRFAAISRVRAALATEKVTVGGWMQLPFGSVAEIYGQANYDWVAVDMEHGLVSHHQLPDLFRALELGNTLPLARLARGHPDDCKKALDSGAGGVIVPMVESAAQLSYVRDVCRWPPAGTRSVAFSRANLFGENFVSYQEEAQSPLLIAMIEHKNALSDLDNILSIEGVDAILIGPYDLSASIGSPGDFESAKYLDAIKFITEQAELHRIPLGIHVVMPSVTDLRARVEEGFQFIAYSIDAVLLQSVIKNPLGGQ